jgi:hypothetical protein
MRRVALATLVLVLVGGVARADGSARGEGECTDRLHWIHARLARTAHRARVWSWSWGLVLGASTVGSVAAVPFVAREDRVDYWVSAATSAVGLVPLLVMPLDVMSDADALGVLLPGAPSMGGPCALLDQAEVMLARDAASEAQGRAWWVHVVNWALNGGAGLVLALGYDHWTSGVLTAVVGGGIGEAMIFTQPVDSVDDLRAYRAGTLTLAPLRVPSGGFGLAIVGTF